MTGIIKKLCINCAYSDEDIEGKHCKRCAENVEDNFVTKEDAKEIRAKAIDEFAERLKLKYPYFVEDVGLVEANKMLHSAIDEIAEEMRGAE